MNETNETNETTVVPSKSRPKPLGAYLKLNTVARSLGMSRNWVRERVRAGEFRGFKLGVSVVIEQASIEEYLKGRALS